MRWKRTAAPTDGKRGTSLGPCGPRGAFRQPVKLRASVAALATDPLALRAVRKLAERFLDGQPVQMGQAEMAAALGVTESDLEDSLRPLVAGEMLLWRKNAA